MSTDKLTRCPHCKAAFKVSEKQLSVANGRVRCGACMNVFDAIAYSLGDAKDAPGRGDNIEPNLDDEIQTSGTEMELDDELIEDNPLEDSSTTGPAERSVFGDELSESFQDLDASSASDLNASYINEIEEARDAPDDESWAADMLKEETLREQQTERPHDEGFQERIEPSMSNTAENEPPDTAFDQFDETTNDQEHISFYYDDTPTPPKRGKLASATLILFNTLLILVLVTLASWFHYEKLAKYPQIASAYKQVCELAGCQLPKLADITKIRGHNLVVRSHPTTRNALIIDAVITNDAGYPQDFPDIALYFSDINNQTIAQRLITPVEYLSPEILAWEKIPSNEPIHISLEIVDPGKEAVNYSLKFFPQKESLSTMDVDQSLDQLSTNQSKI